MSTTERITYGHTGTIHRTNHLNVEVNENGVVVAVWFRCMLLPFDQTVVGPKRSACMLEAQDETDKIKLLAVEVDIERDE